MSSLRERVEGLVAVLDKHDLRRWMRMLKGDGSLDYLCCYCGEKIYEDSNEAMLGHVAAALAAEGQGELTEQQVSNAICYTQDDFTEHSTLDIPTTTDRLNAAVRAAAPSLHKEGAGGEK